MRSPKGSITNLMEATLTPLPGCPKDGVHLYLTPGSPATAGLSGPRSHESTAGSERPAPRPRAGRAAAIWAISYNVYTHRPIFTPSYK